jgi:hypothetical protein
VDKTRPGTFLFNYFVGDDPAVVVRLWDYLAGWYQAETGMDNSTVLAPLEGEKSDYVVINHARWDGSLLAFAARQFAKKSFRSYMLANLDAHNVGAMPILYPPGLTRCRADVKTPAWLVTTKPQPGKRCLSRY